MRSLRYAALLAGGYTLVAIVYIVASSSIAARLSANVEQLNRIETLKGILFVVVTAVATFLGSYYAFARLERAHAQIIARDRALVDNERRVFAGLIAGAIAHDSNNVLVAVIADLEELRDGRPADDPTVQRLKHSVERMIALNRRLLSNARRGQAALPEDVEVIHLVRETLAVTRSHQSVRRCTVEFAPAGPVRLHTHPLLLQQILANLVVNAGEACGGNGRIEVRLHDSPEFVTLEVHDNGPGVPVERRDQLFDALETTKPSGTGLGLFSVKSCVAALEGSVDVGESPLGGACFRVRLPELARKHTGTTAPATGVASAGAVAPSGTGRPL
jgi:two-component system sensor histidine kinase HydH